MKPRNYSEGVLQPSASQELPIFSRSELAKSLKGSKKLRSMGLDSKALCTVVRESRYWRTGGKARFASLVVEQLLEAQNHATH